MEQKDQLRALKLEGYPVDTEREIRVLDEVRSNPEISGVKAAYLYLYAEMDAKAQVAEALANQAEHIAQSKGTYPRVPRSVTTPPTPKDVKDLTPEEFEEQGLEALRDAGV